MSVISFERNLFLEHLFELLLHSFIDCVKMLPVLYLSYLLMELLEHKTGSRMQTTVAKMGKAGPLIGSGLGLIPQCGFSGAVAGLYAGGIATLGTLIAVIIATSDEMLPIMLSGGVTVTVIATILIGKFVCGALCGFAVDLLSPKKTHSEIHELCEQEGCACENHNIFVSSLIHCGKVLLVIFCVTFALELVFHLGGTETASSLIPNIPVVSELVTGLLGLIPSCSVSVLLTELYTENIISGSMLMAGLCTNGGIGLLVLFRLNKNLKENLKTVGIVYVCGVLSGLLIGLFL